MRQVVILSGVSGSGKSRYARNLIALAAYNTAEIVSADSFFLDGAGAYQFDATKLGLAHQCCFRKFIRAIESTDYEDTELVVVDNTNTTAVEISPYVLAGEAYGFDVRIMTLMCSSLDDVKACAERNAHKVPYGSVLAQHNRLLNRSLPPWWKEERYPIGALLFA